MEWQQLVPLSLEMTIVFSDSSLYAAKASIEKKYVDDVRDMRVGGCYIIVCAMPTL